ncbi:penicillin-binding protein, 1A family [Haliangium ochraceum DSM 14365]|uniref:peptidoglycan glycosyltransferase n=1 Tax=Haliangium ochraceum (strain DSM 14365 / JCM 11303 / SMP-2) TaxID=502025 RepID=D0LV55_HALO1|nr:penicillin-binding protein, 1A family [Haliangium ochraceum DSM 14365]
MSPLSLLRLLLLLLVYGLFLGLGGIYYVVAEFSSELPRNLAAALDYRPHRASRVYDRGGQLIGEFFLHKRILVPLERIPGHVQNAFVAAEDGRFWEHPGFDPVGITRAAITNFQSGRTRQGASTITQQITRMLMLSNQRTYERKIKELILSVRVERELSKAEILRLYLNHVYLGRGAYGVQAGAENYFGKNVEHLTAAEAALLAGLVQAPSRYAPSRNLDAARARQRYVLERMYSDGHLSRQQRDRGLAEPLGLVEHRTPLNRVSAPYFVEHIRRWASQEFDPDRVLFGGLHIHTTLDAGLQLSAEAAVRAGLIGLDRRIGFQGPVGHLDGDELDAFLRGPLRPYVQGQATVSAAATAQGLLPDVAYLGAITRLDGAAGARVSLGAVELPLQSGDARLVRQWRRPEPPAASAAAAEGSAEAPPPVVPAPAPGADVVRVGDLVPVSVLIGSDGPSAVRLAQTPDVEAALVALDPHTGDVLAMVGGYDYARSQFNRATQARRQIGSALKPFIYALALRGGMSHLDTVVDAPVAVPTAGGVWTPGNYDGRFAGRVTLRMALAKSLNTVSVRLVLRYGVDRLIELLRAVGMSSPLPEHVSISLGTPDLSPLEVAAGYSAFANGGKRTEPRFVTHVDDDDEHLLLDQRSALPSEQVITPQLAYLVTSLMTEVVESGTGRRAQSLGRPTAGKTGTSSNHRDAWFMGFTADLLCGVWVGRDDFTPIGAKATGGSAALPIWLQFMSAAHASRIPRPFPVPEDIWQVYADPVSGQPKPPGAARGTWIPMARGTVPSKFGVRVRPFADAPWSAFPAAP